MILKPPALAYFTVLVGPRLLNVLCFHVCTCLCMCRERCGWGMTQVNAGSLPQWLSTLIFEAGSFYWPQSRPVWVGWLAGNQQDLPVSTIQTWDPRHTLVSQFLLQILEICSWVLVFDQQALHCLSHLSRPVSHLFLQPARAPENWVLCPLISLGHLPQEVLRSMVKWTSHVVSENSKGFSLKYRDFTVNKTVCLVQNCEHCGNVSCRYTPQCNSNCTAGRPPGVISFSSLYNIL